MSKIYINEGHEENILQRIWKQCQGLEFCDAVVLIAGIEEIRISAHRTVLSAASDYFETMFTSSLDESMTKEVKLPMIDGEICKTLVKYCYTGHVEIREDNVEGLLASAGSLLFDFVINACGDFLAEKLQLTNCLGFALLAEQHHCESLLKLAKDYSYKHFVELHTTDEFLDLNAKQLGQLLSSDHLNVLAEEDVFRGLMAWIENERCEREQYMDELLKLLRMPLMVSSFLVHRVRPECTSADSIQLYLEAMELHSSPNLRTLNLGKSIKPRRFKKFLMAITFDHPKLNILYHCPHKLKWLKHLIPVDFFRFCEFVLMGDDLFLLAKQHEGPGISTIFGLNIFCLNLTTMKLRDLNPLNEIYESASVAVLKGFLYVLGSTENYKIYIEKWDPETDTWDIVTSTSDVRSRFGTVVLNEKFYLIGGCDSWQIALKTAKYYDPEKNTWTCIAPMHIARESPGIAVVEGMLYAVGGDVTKTIERYDPKTDKWTLIGGLKGDRKYRACAALNDKLLTIHNDCFKEYNPLRNEWKVNTSIPSNRISHEDRYFWYSGDLLVSKLYSSV